MDDEQRLRMGVLRADIALKRAQARWEPWTTRVALMTAVVSVVLFCLLAGVLGYQIARLR